jgi:hypothetical protein
MHLWVFFNNHIVNYHYHHLLQWRYCQLHCHHFICIAIIIFNNYIPNYIAIIIIFNEDIANYVTIIIIFNDSIANYIIIIIFFNEDIVNYICSPLLHLHYHHHLQWLYCQLLCNLAFGNYQNKLTKLIFE